MPSGTWVKFEFKEPFSMAIGPGEARVLHGTYVGLPSEDEADVYDLFRMDLDGEPIGESQGRMGATIVYAEPIDTR